MRFPDDGEYVFPGALATLVVADGIGSTSSRTSGSGTASRPSSADDAVALALDETVAASDSTASASSAVDRPRLLGDERSSAARRCRNEPSKRDCLRSGS